MKKNLAALMGALAALGLMSVVALAQQTHQQGQTQHARPHATTGHLQHFGGMSQGAWGMGSTYNQRFQQASMTTVSGHVTGITRFTPERGSEPGIRLMLKTGNETEEVDLGPAWFLDHQSGRLSVGEEVTVVGSRVAAAAEPANHQATPNQQVAAAKPEILAKSVAMGDHELMLRDDQGIPFWDAFRPRQQPTARR